MTGDEHGQELVAQLAVGERGAASSRAPREARQDVAAEVGLFAAPRDLLVQDGVDLGDQLREAGPRRRAAEARCSFKATLPSRRIMRSRSAVARGQERLDERHQPGEALRVGDAEDRAQNRLQRNLSCICSCQRKRASCVPRASAT